MGDAKGGDAKEEKKRRLADAKADAKAGDAALGVPIAKSQLKCAAKADDAAPAKSDAKGDAKADAKDTKLFSVAGQRVSKASSDASSGWVTPLAGCLAVVGVAFAAMKIARTRSARSRAIDVGLHDEESSQEAIE